MAPRDVTVFVLANVAIQWAALAAAAPEMLGAIRADGGTPAEYLVYLWYNAALILAIAWGALVLFGVLRRLGGPAVARAGIVVAEAAVLVGIAAEVLTFTILGLHPYGATTWAAVGTADIRNLPWWFFAGLASVVCGLALGEWALLWGATRLTPAQPGGVEDGVGGRLIGYALIGFAAFLAIDRDDAERLVPRAALPLYSQWIAPARQLPDLRPRRMIGDSLHAPRMSRRPDIVFVMAETLRGDMFTPQRMPKLSRFAAQHGCLVPPRHYTGGHLSQYGAFSMLYGLGGWAFLPYMEQARESWPLAVLRANGYELYGLDATGVLSYAIDPLVPHQFDSYETRLRADSALLDETATLVTQPHDAPRFVFTFIYSTHAPYLYPSDFDPPLIGVDSTVSQPVGFGWARYLRSVRYVDDLVGRLTERLADRLRAGNLILAITGDHGEEFWEFGLQGHAAVRFHDVRVRVPLVLCVPGVDATPPAVSEHADIFPTILTWATHDTLPAGVMSGRSLFQRPDSLPVVLAGSGFPRQAGEFAVLTPRAKFWLTLEDPAFREITLDQLTDLDDRPLPESDALWDVLHAALEEFHRSREHVLRPE